MDQLEQLINPNALSAQELQEMGCTIEQIRQYTMKRTRIWNTARHIFQRMFSYIGRLQVMKDFDGENRCMRVTVYRDNGLSNYDILAQGSHRDPVYALVNCAQQLNNTDDFLSALINGLKI